MHGLSIECLAAVLSLRNMFGRMCSMSTVMLLVCKLRLVLYSAESRVKNVKLFCPKLLDLV